MEQQELDRRWTRLTCASLVLVGILGAGLALEWSGAISFMPESYKQAALLMLGFLLFVCAVGKSIVELLMLPGWSRLVLILFPILLFVLFALVMGAGTPNRQTIATLDAPDGRIFALMQITSGSKQEIRLLQAFGDDSAPWVPVDGIAIDQTIEPDSASPTLYLSSDQRWLLIRRGATWTDCIDLRSSIRNCFELGPQTPQPGSDAWHSRSRAISQLTGLSPEAALEPRPAK